MSRKIMKFALICSICIFCYTCSIGPIRTAAFCQNGRAVLTIYDGNKFKLGEGPISLFEHCINIRHCITLPFYLSRSMSIRSEPYSYNEMGLRITVTPLTEDRVLYVYGPYGRLVGFESAVEYSESDGVLKIFSTRHGQMNLCYGGIRIENI